MSSQSVPVKKADMHVPAMEEVAKVLNDGLEKNFSTVSVNVVECPDLTQKPYGLSAPGLNGHPRLADIGGPPYLTPLPQLNKVYTFTQIAELVDLPGAFMIGAGAGPHKHIGCCCELINDVKLDKSGNVAVMNSHIAKVSTEDGGCIQETLTKNEFSLMGNFLCCDGNPGKVIEIKASKRTGEENFMSCIRKVLGSHYGNKPVALGGVFLVEKGKANLHIMPDFSKTPLTSQEQVGKWLKFYEMDSPLVCLGELVSHDPGMDLRVEHFHCYSEHGQGGHYHNDTTPNEVEYRGYFMLANYVYRVDQPPQTTELAR